MYIFSCFFFVVCSLCYFVSYIRIYGFILLIHVYYFVPVINFKFGKALKRQSFLVI